MSNVLTSIGARALAEKAMNVNLPAGERIQAMIMLNDLVVLAHAVDAVNRAFNVPQIVAEEKPKYVWRNGARVKTK